MLTSEELEQAAQDHINKTYGKLINKTTKENIKNTYIAGIKFGIKETASDYADSYNELLEWLSQILPMEELEAIEAVIESKHRI
jgi:hypothetical protein